ncbi:hypothetical protein H6P81_009551 [Aristolochia fimbriata]|uniref:Uncharacterized protein n=1 Tax=Aristolochia fimbriata TaxID=158543 RepID=A0AAV7EMC1_ARIFI|nr:hypothetical protein H6P81_009551 [Aristolochia fimbriata]
MGRVMGQRHGKGYGTTLLGGLWDNGEGYGTTLCGGLWDNVIERVMKQCHREGYRTTSWESWSIACARIDPISIPALENGHDLHAPSFRVTVDSMNCSP